MQARSRRKILQALDERIQELEWQREVSDLVLRARGQWIPADEAQLARIARLVQGVEGPEITIIRERLNKPRRHQGIYQGPSRGSKGQR